MQGGSPLDWHEAWVLVSGFAKDPSCLLHREIDPDWEWNQVPVLLASMTLQAVQAGNWQRGGGKGARPKLVTAQLLRGDVVSEGGRSASRKDLATVEVGEDLSAVADELAARRKSRTSGPLKAVGR